MKKVTIYTNGKSLFTLEDYSKTAGVSHVLGITIHSEASKNMARAMHTSGQMHRLEGLGDRKELQNLSLNRNMKLNNFKIS